MATTAAMMATTAAMMATTAAMMAMMARAAGSGYDDDDYEYSNSY